MRKRKSPIVLVTMLVVVVAGVVGFNFATGRIAGPDTPPPPPQVENTSPVGEARTPTPAKSVADSVKASLGATGKPSGGPPGRPGPGGPPSGPLILNPSANVKPEKPKPNSSSTSAQWYNQESALGSKG